MDGATTAAVTAAEHREQWQQQASDVNRADRSRIDSLSSVDYPIDWDQLLQPSGNPNAFRAAALLRSRVEHRLYEHEADFLNSLLQMHDHQAAGTSATTSSSTGTASTGLTACNLSDFSVAKCQVDILHSLLRAAHLRLLLNDFLKALKSYERFYAFARQFRSQPHAAEYIGELNFLRDFYYGIAVCYDELNLVHLAREAYNLALHKQTLQSTNTAPNSGLTTGITPKTAEETSSAFVQTIHYRLALLYQDAGLQKLSRKHLLWLRRLVLAASLAQPEPPSPTHPSAAGFVQPYVLRIDFQLGKLCEKSGKIEQAKKAYEEILQKISSPTVTRLGGKQNFSSMPAILPVFKASVLKQLGWLVFMHAEFGDTQPRSELALDCLRQSIDLNEEDGQTWYFIGRCYSALGHVRDAYAAYKNSIDKSDANADTWCSIGILYQQQKQQVDALQAYACAVQLEESHHFAWLNLGMLYESVQQYRDALHCFRRCAETLPEYEDASNGSVGTASKQPANNSQQSVNLLNWCRQRIAVFEKLVQLQDEQTASDPALQPPNTLAHVDQALTSHLAFAEVLSTPCDSTKRRRALLQPDTLRPVPDELSEDRNWDLLNAYQARLMSAPSSKSGSVQPVLNDEQVLQAQCLFELLELRGAVQSAIEQRDRLLKQVQRLEDDFTHQKQWDAISLDAPLHADLEPTDPDNCSNYAKVEAETLFADLEEAVAANFNEFEPAETILSAYRSRYETAFGQEPDGKTPAESNLVDDADDLLANLSYQPIEVVRNSVILPGRSKTSYIFDAAQQHQFSSTNNKWPNLDAYLLPLVPRKSVDTRRDAMNAELERFCTAHPVVIVRNICTALKLDMSLFSTKSIVDRDPQLQIEARVQLKQPMDSNLDHKTGKRTWFVSSQTTYMTLHSYGEYQAGLFVKALADEPTTGSGGGGATGAGGKRAAGGAAKGRSRQNPKDAATAGTAAPAATAAADDTDKASTASGSSRKAPAKQQQGGGLQQQPSASVTAAGAKKKRRSSTATAAAAAAAAATSTLDDEASQASTAETTMSSVAGGVSGQQQQQRPAKLEKILFCTNCDLSDMDKWSLQLAELQKLPRFLRVESATNMLTHLDHKVLGVNTPQLFMKVPGCRTTAHQQPLMFCSVNINIGPGECEWSCVPNEYCSRLRALCAANGVDYLHGSWWPDADQLRAANIPVYRLTQLPGDLVWINPGTIQWVYSTGWNNNIAWNVAPFDARQLALSLERYEWNKLQNYKSLVPMMSLVWSLARNVSVREPLLYRILKYAMRKCLIQSECIAERLRLQYRISHKIIDQQREDGEPAYYCEACEVELFNFLLVKEDKTLGKFLPHCLQCAAAEDSTLGSYLPIQQYSQEQLSDWYDAFQFAC